MWSTLDRTRRRLMRAAPEPDAAPGAEGADGLAGTDTAAEPSVEIVIAIGRPEFERLGRALQRALGPGTTRPDTPDRLQAALAEAIDTLGATGRTRVARRPAGLYTPEAWQVYLIDAQPSVETAIRRAIREGVFTA